MNSFEKYDNQSVPFFIGDNANQLWSEAAKYLTQNIPSRFQEGRGGRVIETLHANLLLLNPSQRWVSIRQPPINPAYAIAECLWFVMGRNDSCFINSWNSQLKNYAGVSDKYHGAYGFRLINHFGINQLSAACDALNSDSTSRQIVLQIWDTKVDLPNGDGKPRNKDIPCNVLSLLKVRDRKLEWTQIVRSNDLFLGVPYNIVLFTFLQELMASWLKVGMGHFYQLSDSLHIYEKDIDNILSTNHTNVKSSFQNTDKIELNKNDTIKYFTDITQRCEAIADCKTELSKIIYLMNWENAPLFLQNYLYVLGAEAARKRNNHEIANSIINKCNNPILSSLWENWAIRLSQHC